MRWLFSIIFGCWLLTFGVVQAATIEMVEMIGDDEYMLELNEAEEQIFLGTLTGQPHLYVVTVQEKTPLSLALFRQSREEQGDELSVMIVVERAPRGVELIARLRAGEVSWRTERDQKTRILAERGHEYQGELEPGTYRIEVSTPTNEGRYELRFGESVESSWWTEVKNMRTLQRWYGVPVWQSLLSPLVYVPFGIVFVVGGIGWLWWHRRNRYV